MDDVRKLGVSPYREIVVLCGPETPTDARLLPLKVAVETARRFDAGLTGLCLAPHPPMEATADDAPKHLAGLVKSRNRKAAHEMKSSFSDLARDAGVAARWCVSVGDDRQVIDSAVGRMRTADLVIAGQKALPRSGDEAAESCYRLVQESGRPVVFVPDGAKPSGFGERVVIAWDGSREAARAVNDALPVLQQARSVLVLRVDNGRTGAPPGIGDDAGIAGYLRAHGIRTSHRQAYVGRRDEGETILSRVADTGADLVVMGAYGRSMPDGVTLGGATRRMLDGMTVPVLMSC